jgi:predicted nucleic acid-binding protein
VLRWLEGGEPAASRVQDMMASRPIMSWINAGEVYYLSWRSGGRELAGSIVDELRRTLVLDAASPERVVQAAAVKAEHPMAFADAFAVATAKAHDAVLVTGDPEILDAGTGCATEDLR